MHGRDGRDTRSIPAVRKRIATRQYLWILLYCKARTYTKDGLNFSVASTTHRNDFKFYIVIEYCISYPPFFFLLFFSSAFVERAEGFQNFTHLNRQWLLRFVILPAVPVSRLQQGSRKISACMAETHPFNPHRARRICNSPIVLDFGSRSFMPLYEPKHVLVCMIQK